MNVEIIRNTLYKAYIEDFHEFCQTLGGATGEVMGEILAVRIEKRRKKKRERIKLMCVRVCVVV